MWRNRYLSVGGNDFTSVELPFITKKISRVGSYSHIRFYDNISVGKDVIVILAMASPSLWDSSWSLTETLSYRLFYLNSIGVLQSGYNTCGRCRVGARAEDVIPQLTCICNPETRSLLISLWVFSYVCLIPFVNRIDKWRKGTAQISYPINVLNFPYDQLMNAFESW